MSSGTWRRADGPFGSTATRKPRPSKARLFLLAGPGSSFGEPLTAEPFAAAVTWLRAAQRNAGDWNAGAVASPAVATGNAVVALTTIAGPDDPAVRRGVDWLLAAQSREGDWMGGQQRADVCFEIVATTAPLAALGRYRGRRDAA